MVRYRQEVEGKNGWSRWIKPEKRGYKLACCDCGLVHTMQFEHVSAPNGTFILFRAKRNNRATGQKRRYMKMWTENGWA